MAKNNKKEKEIVKDFQKGDTKKFSQEVKERAVELVRQKTIKRDKGKERNDS